MACQVTKGRNLLPCKNPNSGIRAIYIIPFGDTKILPTNYTADGTGLVLNNLDDLDLYSGSNLTGVNVYKYALKGDNTFEENSTEGGAFSQSLVVRTVNLTKEMQFQAKMLALGYNRVVVEKMNGDYFIVGMHNALTTQVKANVAGAMDAVSEYLFTFTGLEDSPVFYLHADAVADLQAAVSADNIL